MRFQKHLQSLGLKYERRIKFEESSYCLDVTIEFWVPPMRSYSGRCTHVFFASRHPNKGAGSRRRTSYRVLALVDGKKCSLRDAWFTVNCEAGKF